jgi:hypothetical protein
VRASTVVPFAPECDFFGTDRPRSGLLNSTMNQGSVQTDIGRGCVMVKANPNQDNPTAATTTQAQPAPSRRPYDPPTLVKRGRLSALVAQTITATPPPNLNAG